MTSFHVHREVLRSAVVDMDLQKNTAASVSRQASAKAAAVLDLRSRADSPHLETPSSPSTAAGGSLLYLPHEAQDETTVAASRSI